MTNKAYDISITSPHFYADANDHLESLKAYSKDELKELYKSSDKIIDKTHAYYHALSEPVAALNAYDGLVFKQLELNNYKPADFDYLNDKLRILSTLYGALRPSDGIHPYRLDYLMPFHIDMYDFWHDKLTDYFAKEELIINLASNEFSKSFRHPNIVNIHFINEAGKSLATAAKMARGQFINFMTENKVSGLEEIKEFSWLNYRYQSSLSDSNNLYFQIEEGD